METALMVLGLFVFAIVLMWAYSYINDAREVNAEERRDVRAESPHEHEQAMFKERAQQAQNASDEAVRYSSEGDGGSEGNSE